MKTEQKQQARNLFFQTELTKTQIANLLNISRRTMSYWVKEGNWNRLKKSVNHMPAILAENCYLIFGHLTEYYLSERRLTNPVSYKEVDTLHKLTLTIKNLKSRATINESMQVLTCMLDNIKQHDEPLAEKITPYVDEYIAKRADIYTSDLMPEHLTGIGGRIPWEPEDRTETLIDAREDFFSDPETIETYEKYNIPFPDEDEISTIPPSPPTPTPTPEEIRERSNAERLRYLQGLSKCKETPQQPANEEQITPPKPESGCPKSPLTSKVETVRSEQRMCKNPLSYFYNNLIFNEMPDLSQKHKNRQQGAQNQSVTHHSHSSISTIVDAPHRHS